MTHHFLLFIPTIQIISPKYIHISFIFSLKFRSFYHKDGHKTVGKGRRPTMTDDPEEGPEALNFLKTAGVGQQLQLVTALINCPRRGQPEPLPTVKGC